MTDKPNKATKVVPITQSDDSADENTGSKSTVVPITQSDDSTDENTGSKSTAVIQKPKRKVLDPAPDNVTNKKQKTFHCSEYSTPPLTTITGKRKVPDADYDNVSNKKNKNVNEGEFDNQPCEDGKTTNDCSFITTAKKKRKRTKKKVMVDDKNMKKATIDVADLLDVAMLNPAEDILSGGGHIKSKEKKRSMVSHFNLI